MEEVTIQWYGPYALHRMDLYDVAWSNGIYAVYRTYGDVEKLIYIGQTRRSFRQRLDEHWAKWLQYKRGDLRVRLGQLEFGERRRFSRKKLNDVEALLIMWHKPTENTAKVDWYGGRRHMTIVNAGRRGQLDRIVSTNELQ